jgi:nucleoside diphosphate kinase
LPHFDSTFFRFINFLFPPIGSISVISFCISSFAFHATASLSMSEQNIVIKDVVATLADVNPTRTVAIIKPHALDHRFEIEHRITEAKFEIVKERQMEFDVDTDPDTLLDLFGEDAHSFADGPVWVYVLERRRAIEVWNTIMGDADPQIAREQSPSSLRALYGITRDQNAIMGSPDVEIAEIQIASLFVSSPPYPISNLPEEYSASLRSVSSTLPSHSPRRVQTSNSGHSAAGSSATNGTQQRTPFKAREIPISHVSPTIVPRTTRAADLRAGVTPPKVERSPGPRTPPSKEAQQKMFANIPGHKRSSVIAVASTAPPVVAPRMTRAASLRISGAPPPRPVRPKPIITLAQAKAKAQEEARVAAVLKEAQARTFDGVPGHKRRESFSVASTKAPAVSPRQNRAAVLRTSKDTPPPSSYQFRSPVAMSRPSLSQSSSSSSAPYSTSSPSYSRPASAQGNLISPRRSLSRASDIGGAVATPQRSRPNSLQAPTIAPRPNRSAMLRVAKMANGV